MIAVFFAGLLVGCGPNCQSTCGQIFDESACDLASFRPGLESHSQTQRCIEACELALNTPGRAEEYDPNVPKPSSEVDLENEMEAKEWMDCIWETAPDGTEDQCDALREGYCAPTAF